MYALSFIGIGNYSEVIYADLSQGLSYKSQYFTEALYHIYKPDKIFIAMTDEAKVKHYENLKSKFEFETIIIPKGRSTDEIWEIFSIISEKIPRDTELIIDITHGFRSQPLLALLIAIFLRTIKNVKIKKIVYGAYDAKNDETNVAPIFDLTSFINLIDWAYATDMFIKYGNGQLLSKLLKSIHNQVRIEKSKFTNLLSFGALLEKITEALALIRPQEISEYGKILPKKLEKVDEDIKNIQVIKPLKYLLEIIPPSFSSLVFSDSNLFSEAGFRTQAEMIKYYIETHQYVQAITLSRELLVSLACKNLNLNFTKREERQKAENYLNEITNSLIQGNKLNDFEEKMANLWGKIRDVRNDINHAGMREEIIPASAIKNLIIEYCSEVINLLDNAH